MGKGYHIICGEHRSIACVSACCLPEYISVCVCLNAPQYECVSEHGDIRSRMPTSKAGSASSFVTARRWFSTAPLVCVGMCLSSCSQACTSWRLWWINSFCSIWFPPILNRRLGAIVPCLVRVCVCRAVCIVSINLNQDHKKSILMFRRHNDFSV